jgi:uncharacterized protein (DUF2252 family)
MRFMGVKIWYSSIDVEDFIEKSEDKETAKRMKKRLAKAKERSVLEHDFPELAVSTGVAATIRDNPPLIFHRHQQDTEVLQAAFARYRETLQEDRRLLLDRYKLMDAAIKVVGVGSVGTYCGILLLMASDHDPLFLQFKHARPSVLEAYAGKSPHANNGERVVHGCRMMQSASDLFLGWTVGEADHHFYIRQLKDMKIKPLVEIFTPGVMLEYAELCGWTLAHAHARSGEPTVISGYLGQERCVRRGHRRLCRGLCGPKRKGSRQPDDGRAGRKAGSVYRRTIVRVHTNGTSDAESRGE